MLTQGIGTDIVAVERIRKLIARYGSRFIAKVYTVSEIDYCNTKPAPHISFAGRFAAKEAVAKAAYQAGHDHVIPLKHIEILNDAQGRPLVNLPDDLDIRAQVSISHEKEFAVAMARAEMG